MPFIVVSGRLNFGKFRFAGSGGGAIFRGEKDGLDYDEKYSIRKYIQINFIHFLH